MYKKNIRITKSLVRFFSKNKLGNIKLTYILSIFFFGVTSGIAYEEMVGIGTWHSYDNDTKKINICFTPPSGCGSLIAKEIVKARDTIYMQAYNLTSKSIIFQLKRAYLRGVSVNILVDGGNLSDNKNIYRDLKNAGINILFDKMSGIAHNKVIIIDELKVVTGSFNFTKSADYKNAENVLLIEDAKISYKYLQNWKKRWNISKSNFL